MLNERCFQLFLELLQIAISQREELTSFPTSEDWRKIYSLSHHFSLVGIVFVGIEKLAKQGVKPPQSLLFDWFGLSEQIWRRNKYLRDKSQDVIRQFLQKGVKASVLKGQGLSLYYPQGIRQYRQSNDIDVYVDCGAEMTLNLVRALSSHESIKWDYRHAHIHLWEDVELEVHYHVEMLLNPFRNVKLQAWFKNNEELLFYDDGEMVTPSLQMNVFYVLMHIYRHFLFERIGIKQLLDYYYVLKSTDGKSYSYANGESIVDILESFGMLRFARGIMWVMEDMFLLERSYMLCNPLKEEGMFILKCIMNSDKGSTIIHDKGKLSYLISFCKNNMRLFKHYPLEIMWDPIWVIWHKLWKIKHGRKVFIL